MKRDHRLALVIGFNQLLSWGTTFYLPAVVAGAVAGGLGASRVAVVGAFSWSLLISGLCAPRMGRWIDRRGGRGVLASSTVIMALGLVLLASAPGVTLWYVGWTVIGVGMALGLYDAAFATIGRLLGSEAGAVITGVTLIGGFASTVGWLSGVAIVGLIGWRATLLAYAGLQLTVNLPLVLLLVPRVSPQTIAETMPTRTDSRRFRTWTLSCLASFFTLRWLITSAISVYVLVLFRGIGLTAGEAVVAAALIGPGQVAGRIVDWALGTRLNVLARARIGAALFPLAAVALGIGGPIAAYAFALLYGMSNGILTINRGTLPLAIFGPAGYAGLIGWLAVPVLLAQAAAPTLAAPVVAALSPLQVFLLAGGLAALALVLLLLFRMAQPSDTCVHNPGRAN